MGSLLQIVGVGAGLCGVVILAFGLPEPGQTIPARRFKLGFGLAGVGLLLLAIGTAA